VVGFSKGSGELWLGRGPAVSSFKGEEIENDSRTIHKTEALRQPLSEMVGRKPEKK